MQSLPWYISAYDFIVRNRMCYLPRGKILTMIYHYTLLIKFDFADKHVTQVIKLSTLLSFVTFSNSNSSHMFDV